MSKAHDLRIGVQPESVLCLTVAVVSPFRFYGEALARALAARHPDLDVVATCAKLADALDHPARPALILLDLLSGSDLLVEARRLRAERKTWPSLILVGTATEATALRAWASLGVVGYVSRSDSLEGLEGAIRLSGHARISRQEQRSKAPGPALARLGPRADNQFPLTERESEVLKLLEEGYSNKQIATALGVSLSTVKNHVHHILVKLGVPRRGLAAALARRDRASRGERTA